MGYEQERRDVSFTYIKTPGIGVVECGIDWRRENGGWGLGRRLGQGSRGSVVMERRDDMERSWGQEGGTWGLSVEASEEVRMAVEGPMQ